MLAKRIWFIVYVFISLLVVLLFDLQLIALLAIVFLFVIILLKRNMRRQVDVSTLNFRNISWLSYLSSLDKPAGIIHNSSDTIVWLNSRSQLKVGGKTTKLHIDDEKLIKIRDIVAKLNDVDVENREQSSVELSYLLRLNHPLQVRDRFYKMLIGSECFRIFECLEIGEI